MEILSPFHYLPIGDSPADVSTLLSALAKLIGSKESSSAVTSQNPHRASVKVRQILFPFPQNTAFPAELQEYETRRKALPESAVLALSAPAAGSVICYSQLAIKTMADAVNAAVGRPGRWILATPATEIDGIMTLARAIAVGIPPIIAAKTRSASVKEILRAVERAKDRSSRDEAPIYMQITKTQLGELLEIPPAERADLQAVSSLMVTGLTSHDLLARAAKEAGIEIVKAYGIP